MLNVISNEMDVSAKYQMTVLLNISRYQITAAKNISSTCIKKIICFMLFCLLAYVRIVYCYMTGENPVS